MTSNEEQLANGAPTTNWISFGTSSDFVVDVDVAENWQSEFLAVGAMVTLSIFLRQRGSHESQPVGTPTTRRPSPATDGP